MQIKKKLVSTFFIFSFLISFSQVPIRVEVLPDGFTPGQQDSLNDWVLNNLHGGGGMIDTASIRFDGNSQAFGRFWGGTDLSRFCNADKPGCMDEGMIISTGKAEQAAIYDPSDGHSSFSFGTVQDGNPPYAMDLRQMYKDLNGDNDFFIIGDVAVLEFDYTPFENMINLRYIFASEEYPNALDKDDVDKTSGGVDFDLFGIFVDLAGSPPPIGKVDNYAILPALIAPDPPDNWVTLQSVNAGSGQASMFFTSNELDGLQYQPIGFEFDGMTKPMDAIMVSAAVQACKKYHIKISIADYISEFPPRPESNFPYNSALFLGKGSLKGGMSKPNWTVNYEFTNPAFEGNLVEGGCNDLLVTFTLDSEPYGLDDYKIPFQILTSNYSSNILITYEDTGLPLNDTVVFADGVTVKTLRLSAVNINADVATVKFNYSTDPCDYPRPPFGNTGYSGDIIFGMINNEPISFTQDPKVYNAYCMETIQLNITDVTTGGVDPLIYVWPGNPFPPVETYTHTVVANPDFVPVKVMDLCGNEKNTQVQINNKPVQLDQLPPISFCQPGQTTSVEAIVSVPDYPGYTFTVEWTKVYGANTTFLGTGNPFTIIYDNAIGEDQWTCIYKITDVCGGEAEGSFIVDQTGKLDLGPDKNICKGESRLLQTFTPAKTYKWYVLGNPSNVLSNTSSVTVTPLVTTTYVLEIIDECDLFQIDEIIVNVDQFEPQITITPSSAEVCPDEPVTFTANDANSWLWTPGNQTTQSITVSESLPGIYTYTLTASSTYCIDKQTSASFEVFPLPSAVFSFDPSNDACTGEEIQFTYGADPNGKQFQWDFGDGATSTLPNPVHSYTNEGNYTVSLNVDQYICSDASTMNVLVNPLPTASFTASNTEGCLPVEVQFSNSSQDITPSSTYEWTFGDGSSSNLQNPSHEYTTAGLYTVSLKVTNTARCFASIVQPNLVQVNPNPVAGFEADPWITTLDTPDIEFFNQSVSDSTLQYFEWDFGDGTTSTDENPVHTYLVAGEYEISFRVETINTCWDTVFGKVAVTEEVKLFIPNAFTPNGDGTNDVFEIKGTPISNFNLYIYDRWGGQIWSTHNFETRWDGSTEGGEQAPAGTYIYQISGTDYLKRDVNFKGTVTIVR